jgi:hypothetical protein
MGECMVIYVGSGRRGRQFKKAFEQEARRKKKSLTQMVRDALIVTGTPELRKELAAAEAQ